MYEKYGNIQKYVKYKVIQTCKKWQIQHNQINEIQYYLQLVL